MGPASPVSSFANSNASTETNGGKGHLARGGRPVANGSSPPQRYSLRRTTRALRTAEMGLGRVNTQARCGAVEWRSQASDVLSFSLRLASWRPVTQRRRNLENSAV